MTDLISREAALECFMGLDRIGDIKDAIAAMPAAQVDYRAEYYHGWNDAMASIPKRVIDDPAMFAKALSSKRTPDPVVNDPRVKALVEAVDYILDGMGLYSPDYEIDPEDDFLDAANGHWVMDTLSRLAAALRAIGGEA